MDENTRTEVDLNYKQTLSGVFVLIFITFFILISGWIISAQTDFSINDKLSYLIILSIIILAGVIIYLRTKLFRWGNIVDRYEQNGLNAVFKLLHNNTLLLGILNVLIALLGFILALLEGNKFQVLKISIISLILFIIIFPRKKIWKIVINRLEN